MKPKFIKKLSKLLSLPSQTFNERRVIDYISSVLKDKKITHTIDPMGNIMAVKGQAEYYPCLVAHTDTVHQTKKSISIKQVLRPNSQGVDKISLVGHLNGSDVPVGCGGDDKAGVYTVLELIDQLDSCKAFFPVAEETGCHGSKGAPIEWFKDVGYFIQFDCPHNNIMSRTLMGLEVYSPEGEFFKSIQHKLTHLTPVSHPFTDVMVLKKRTNLECLNLPVGYYQYHTPFEYVVVEDVMNAIKLGGEIIEILGNKLYKSEMSKVKDDIYASAREEFLESY